MANGYKLGALVYQAAMKTDALNRRLRFAKPQRLEERIELTENDYAVFRALDRHGPLPTNYLFELTGRKHLNTFQNRLTKLYNGARNSSGFLVRPPQQFLNVEARYQPLVYDLALEARRLLVQTGYAQRFSPKRTDPFLHRFMTACVSASFEFAAQRAGIRYINREEILSKEKCPEGTKIATNPLSIPIGGGKCVIPDDLFGFQYPEGGFRFFAVEIDRNTESIHGRRQGQNNTLGRKLQSYIDVLRHKTYRSHWGLPNLTILLVTTNQAHLNNTVEHLQRLRSEYEGKFCFKAWVTFGAIWKVPNEPQLDLVSRPWTRAAGDLNIAKSA